MQESRIMKLFDKFRMTERKTSTLPIAIGINK